MTAFIKYPRTPHLPWSPGRSDNDTFLLNTDTFIGKQVIVTEKMDGENTSLYKKGVHHRSLDDKNYHSSRTWVKNLHAQIAHEIPAGFRICGENLFAKHSIPYTNLPTYFMVFSMWSNTLCLSWKETLRWTEILGLTTAPVLYEGEYNEKVIKSLLVDTSVSEGYVVRNAESFNYEDFDKNVAKWVREDHIQGKTHWMYKSITPNSLDKSPRA